MRVCFVICVCVFILIGLWTTPEKGDHAERKWNKWIIWTTHPFSGDIRQFSGGYVKEQFGFPFKREKLQGLIEKARGESRFVDPFVCPVGDDDPIGWCFCSPCEVGGGINTENAAEYLEAGLGHLNCCYTPGSTNIATMENHSILKMYTPEV